MNLHEYQGRELFARFGIPVLPGQVAGTPEEARDIADSKGFMSLNALAIAMGRERLRAAFREILRDFRERRLSWDDFLAVLTRAAGRDISWFYAQWFDRSGAPELFAEPVESAPAFRIRQPRNPYRLTVDVAVFGAGCGEPLRITVSASEERVQLSAGCRADSVVVDPDYQILRWTPELRARFDRR